MFVGLYTICVDNYMRIKIPQVFLCQLTNGNALQPIYMTKISDDCVVIMKQERLEALVNGVDIFDKHKFNKVRAIMSSTFVCEPDTRGRIIIPAPFSKKLPFFSDSPLTCIGAGGHIELWNPLIYEHYSGISLEEMIDSVDMPNNAPTPLLFLSYSRKDYTFVEQLSELTNKLGIKTFLDKKDILPGEYIVQKIQHAIDKADFYIFIASKNSVESEWCNRELSQALEIEIKKKSTFIIPLKIDDCIMPGLIRNKNYIDCVKDKFNGFNDLIHAVINLPRQENL